ncbi:Outer membrane porin F precursor [Ruegeria denitrificans]|uniref:Outer membrane porin F n=1 Tax=Ruegeria denitrificans TaxID=1715692 RepID=A0A0P1I9K0_9RHOB|nr:DUF1214 domain-containing protein [Ruegeria denitrificans]CUJ99525.1 Outer membrane porin F precursor [Ruegeria denitrificans]
MISLKTGLTAMVLALAVTAGPIKAQQFGQERARAVGELTDAAVVSALREDGRVSMSGGFFETDSDALSGTSPEVLFKVASAMATLPEMRLAIVGHTDSVGDFTYNIDLAERRATAVRNALMAEPYNVAAERLVAMGAGPIAPVASNLSDEGRALNRRVEFVLLDEELMEQGGTVQNEIALPSQSDAEYAAKVPENVLTPDQVETNTLGTLEFFDGMPSPDTVQKTFDNLDLVRATTAFLDGMKIASLRGMFQGYEDLGAQPNDVVIAETLLDARSIWLTPNTTTIYIGSNVDVSEGPMVIEVPAGLLGLLDDAAFEYVADIGALGADKGEGGKYLLLHNDDDTVVPEGYFELRTKTYEHWLLLRRSPGPDGDTAGPVAEIKAGLNVYPLSEAENRPAETFINMSGTQHNTVHANNEDFFEEIHVALDNNPIGAFSPEIVGTFASIGIKKGEPFEPDARMQGIYREAAAIANATARSITYASRDPGVFFYKDRRWNSPFQRQSYLFLEDGARILDDRTYFFYMATGITPAMTSPPVGSGSVYAMTARDMNGEYLDGSKTYKITLPTPIPAKNFVSFMLYSGQTRSILETDQQAGGIDSNREGIKPNEDGSYTIYFGPEAPEGWENNWAETAPGRSFNVMMRLYGPLEPWFDKSWKPGDLELVE